MQLVTSFSAALSVFAAVFGQAGNVGYLPLTSLTTVRRSRKN